MSEEVKILLVALSIIVGAVAICGAYVFLFPCVERHAAECTTYCYYAMDKGTIMLPCGTHGCDVCDDREWRWRDVPLVVERP